MANDQGNQGPHFLLPNKELQSEKYFTVLPFFFQKLRMWNFRNDFFKVRNGLIGLHVRIEKNSAAA